MTPTQLELSWPGVGPVAHPVVILRLVEHHGREMVEATWPDFKLRSWFRDWPAALRCVLSETNDHVIVKVRP